MATQTFNSTVEAKKAHWFSRRHQTADAHLEAKALREARRDKSRQRVPVKRTPQQQLNELDRRLGVGVGAVRERARLQAALAAKETK